MDISGVQKRTLDVRFRTPEMSRITGLESRDKNENGSPHGASVVFPAATILFLLKWPDPQWGIKQGVPRGTPFFIGTGEAKNHAYFAGLP